jgi:hypothetical protein
MGALLGAPDTGLNEAAAGAAGLGSPLTRFLPLAVWGLLPAIVVLGFARRDRVVWVVSLWCLLLIVVADSGLLGLPVAGADHIFSVLGAAYIPAGLLLGIGAGWAADLLGNRLPPAGLPVRAALGTLLLAACLWGAAGQVRLIDTREHALLTRPDLAAFAWVDANLPPDAVFLVNLFSVDGESVAGSDGGWWLPYFTRRGSVLPPLPYLSEKPKSPTLPEDLAALAGALKALDPGDPDVLARLESFGVTHVYIGQRQGWVNSGGATLEPAPFIESSRFDLLYHFDRVWIFAIKP